MSGYGFRMDPIRTAVKYALIPLRTVVQLGELFVEAGQSPEPAPEPVQAKPRPAEQAQRQRTAARKRAQAPRKKPDPQASNAPKQLDDVALARKVETVLFR